MYTYITHPNTGLRYSTDSKMGKSIIINYIQHLTGGEAVPTPPPQDVLSLKFTEAIQGLTVPPLKVGDIVRSVDTLLHTCPDKWRLPSVCWQYTLDQGRTIDDLQIFSDWGTKVVDIIMSVPFKNIPDKLVERIAHLEFGPARGVFALREVLRDLNDFIAAKNSSQQVGGVVAGLGIAVGVLGVKFGCVLVVTEIFAAAAGSALYVGSLFIGGASGDGSSVEMVEPVEEPVEEPSEEPSKEPIEEPVEEPVEEPEESPTQMPDEELVDGGSELVDSVIGSSFPMSPRNAASPRTRGSGGLRGKGSTRRNGWAPSCNSSPDRRRSAQGTAKCGSDEVVGKQCYYAKLWRDAEKRSDWVTGAKAAGGVGAVCCPGTEGDGINTVNAGRLNPNCKPV